MERGGLGLLSARQQQGMAGGSRRRRQALWGADGAP